MEKKEDIIAGNRLIAEFMGANLTTRNGELAVRISPDHPYPEYFRVTSYNKYHELWEVQIPAWTKIVIEVRKLIEQKELNGYNYQRWLSEYEMAVHSNRPDRGYLVLIEMLNWYNAQSTKTQQS